MLGAMGHADLLERLVNALLALGGGHAAVGEREARRSRKTVRSPMRLNDWKMKPISRFADAGRGSGERQALDWAAVEQVGAVGRPCRAGRGWESNVDFAASRTGRRSRRIRPCECPCGCRRGAWVFHLVGEKNLGDRLRV